MTAFEIALVTTGLILFAPVIFALIGMWMIKVFEFMSRIFFR